MATLATEDMQGNFLRYSGGIGVNANDVVAGPIDAGRYDTITFFSTAGAMNLLAAIDSVPTLVAMAFEDLGAASAAGPVFVTVTAANRLYRIRNTFSKVELTQNGATAVTGATIILSRLALQGT
ncbi:MAG TPA: hypothetical protein VGG49_13095 [Steroidobacteraceae bacterium]|jgi:hypothetical protein